MKDMDKVRKKATPRVLKAKSKPKEKKKKIENRIIIAARSRLEPRLSLPNPKKEKKKEEAVTTIEKDKRLAVSLIADDLKSYNLKKTSHLESASVTKDTEKSGTSGARSTGTRKKKIHQSSLDDVESQDADENDIEDFFKGVAAQRQENGLSETNNDGCGASGTQNRRKSHGTNVEENCAVNEKDIETFLKRHRQRRLKGTMYWKDGEIKALAYALQYHGFSDMKKVAAEVKTKTANDIDLFLKSRINERRRAQSNQVDEVNEEGCEQERQRGRPKSSWTCVRPEELHSWPNIRKWRRLAYEQMLSTTRAKDYSRPVISALCNKFYEEEEEHEDPQVINTKLIYKFMADCMLGKIPPQLPPKESALVLDMMREVNAMQYAYDFEEERQFLKDYKGATTFRPIQVKDEFRKRHQKTSEETETLKGFDNSTAVPVPEEVFCDLSRHKRLVQSFNPLVTPMWLVQKEQEVLEKHFEEPSVYID